MITFFIAKIKIKTADSAYTGILPRVTRLFSAFFRWDWVQGSPEEQVHLQKETDKDRAAFGNQ